MGVPTNNAFERASLLSRLNEIRIRTFPDEGDDSPSDVSFSELPTPDGEERLRLPGEAMDTTDTSPLGLSLTGEEGAPITMPSAPVMKDYDSFTDGTHQGSFDSIPAAGEDLNGATVLAVTNEHLTMSFPPQDEESMREAIELWREDVSMSYEPGYACTSSAPSTASAESRGCSKRPRSLASSTDEVYLEEQARRRLVCPKAQRARAQSMSSVTSTVNSFAWMNAETPIPARPPSRAAVG